MKSEFAARLPLDRSTRPGVGLASTVDALIREQAARLITELKQQTKIAYADQPPVPKTPYPEIQARLDKKRQELQEHLDLGDELRQRLQVLEAVTAPPSNELRVRVLILQGSIYDFGRIGKTSHRERLDRALRNAAQMLKAHWNIVVVFGQPKVVERGTGAWELTPGELWRLGDLYASEGTPALLFADRILIPDKTLPHSWGRSDRSIACVAENEWLDGGDGFITAHNLAHLLGLDDAPAGQGLMSHDETDLRLNPGQIEHMQRRVAERSAGWTAENAAARQQCENALDMAQRTVVLLEQQGDLLWQLYQTCLERMKETPARGLTSMRDAALPSPALSRLAHKVKLLSQQVAQAEQELATAQEMLAEVQNQLQELSSKT